MVPFFKFFVMESVLAILFSTMISAILTDYGSKYQKQSQMDLLDVQQQFNHDEALLNREFLSEDERFKRMVQIGFNPDLAAQSVMGVGASSGFAASSPNAPTLPNIGANWSQLLGSFPGNMLAALQQPAEIENIEAHTRGQNLENFWFPITQQTQIDLWTKHSENFISSTNLNNALSDVYREEGKWIGPHSQAELNKMHAEYVNIMSDAILNFESVETQEALQSLYSAESSEAYASASEHKAEARLFNAQAEEQETENTWLYVKKQILDNGYTESWYDAQLKYFDWKVRDMLGGFETTTDFDKLYYLLKATKNDYLSKLADDMFLDILTFSREQYDYQIQTQMDNFWKLKLLGIDVGDFVPNMYMPIGGGMTTAPKAVPVGPKNKVNTGGKNPKPNTHQNVNGKDVRVDSHGTVWINGVPQD